MSSIVGHKTNNSHFLFNRKSLNFVSLSFISNHITSSLSLIFLDFQWTLPWVSGKNVFITWKNLYQCRTMSHSSNLTKKSISPSKVSSYVVGHYCHIISFFFKWTTECFSAFHDKLSWVNCKDTREWDFDLNFKRFLFVSLLIKTVTQFLSHNEAYQELL